MSFFWFAPGLIENISWHWLWLLVLEPGFLYRSEKRSPVQVWLLYSEWIKYRGPGAWSVQRLDRDTSAVQRSRGMIPRGGSVGTEYVSLDTSG